MRDQMYFNNEHDIVLHLATLMKLSTIDGCFSAEENNFINTLFEGYTKVKSVGSYDEMLLKIKNISVNEIEDWFVLLQGRPVAARNLIKDLITLAYVDNRYSDIENTFVEEAALKMGISRAVMHSIENAVRGAMIAIDALRKCIACEM